MYALLMLGKVPRHCLKTRFQTSSLGSSVNRGSLLLPQHVGSRLTKFLPSASTPC
jgi:hypothetical protein